MKKGLLVLVLLSLTLCVSCSNTKNNKNNLFNHGLIQVKSEETGLWSYLNNDDEDPIDVELDRMNSNGFDEFGYASAYQDNEIIVYSLEGEIFTSEYYQEDRIVNYGYNRVITYNYTTSTTTLREMDGTVVLESTDFTMIQYFTDNIIITMKDDVAGLEICDINAEKTIDGTYYSFTQAIIGETDYFIAINNNRYYVYDESGDLVNNEVYGGVMETGYNHLLSVQYNDKYYLLNLKNGERIDLPSKEHIIFNSHGMGIVNRSNDTLISKGAIIDDEGTVLYESDYLLAESIRYEMYMDMFVLLARDNDDVKCLITGEGELVFVETDSETIESYTDEYYVTHIENKYYLKDLDGDIIYESDLLIEMSDSNNFYIIEDTQEDEAYIYNMAGDIVLDYEPSSESYYCYEDYIILGSLVSNRAKLYDSKGDLVTDQAFDFIESTVLFDVFDDGYIVMSYHNLYGVIDLKGNIVIPFDYLYISPVL